MWLKAKAVDVCGECGSDIWPADEIFSTVESGMTGWGAKRYRKRLTLCKDCGTLYEDSQELGDGH